MTARNDHAEHVELNRHYWDDEEAAVHGPLAHGHWSATEPHWGLWATPESQVLMLPQDAASMDAIELGCGTGYVSSWLVRAGARPVDPGGRPPFIAWWPAGVPAPVAAVRALCAA